MQKSEVQIIFYLLLNKENASKTVREIAEATNTSVGSVHNTLSDLQKRGYLVEEGKKRLLRKRQSLIERWIIGYSETLKPKLFVSRFAFLSPSVREQWQKIQLPKTLSWGGEAAAALIENYIQPERWDIYTSDKADSLIVTGRMIPAPQGEIFVYHRFWNGEGMPLLLVYADLLANNDDRCREAAERIKHLL